MDDDQVIRVPSEMPQQHGPYVLTPVVDQHRQQSRELIARAALTVAGGRALVLGADACDEIPLADLAARFQSVTLSDSHPELLERGIAEANLPPESRIKVDTYTADLTGITTTTLVAIDAILSETADPAAAIEQMAALVEKQEPRGVNLEGKYELVVASCVLAQLHVDLTQRAAEAFGRRFSGQGEALRNAPRWGQAVYTLARRMETQFVTDLARLLAVGGLIYLSESVQMCYVQLSSEGLWESAGTYGMLRTKELADYIDRRFAIIERGRWFWVVSSPRSPGETGRLYDVQALVLRVWRKP